MCWNEAFSTQKYRIQEECRRNTGYTQPDYRLQIKRERLSINTFSFLISITIKSQTKQNIKQFIKLTANVKRK